MVKQWVFFIFIFMTSRVMALDRIEAHPNETSMSGATSGATDFQFGVTVSGSLDQKIEQLQRELRLLQFSRDKFPQLSETISDAGTNRLMSECLKILSAKIGKPIPMNLGTNDFKTGEFVFENIPVVKALKYLVAFNTSILDVSDGQLVCKPVSQALLLDESEYRLLRLMAMKDYPALESELENSKLNLAKIRDHEGQTLLHLAVADNQTNIAEQLIARGCLIDARSDVGYTPLHEAVRDESLECVRLLLRHGADLNISDNNNNTPIFTAMHNGHRDIADALVAAGAPIDIFTASALGMTARVKKMLDEGVRYENIQSNYLANKFPENGITFTGMMDPYHTEPGSYMGTYNVSPLHWAARGGSTEVVSLLISNGESISLRDSQGETPLFWAAAAGQVQTAALLIKQGANVNATNYFGGTPLLIATRGPHVPELTELLIAAKADANAKDAEGENALHKLAWVGCPDENIEVAKILLNAGADINARNNDGKTPLDVLLDNDYKNPGLVELYRSHARAKDPTR